MEKKPCPICGKPLIEREKDYYCLNDDALFDKQTGEEIHPIAMNLETEMDYEEAKLRLRANMKGLWKKTDRDLDKIIEDCERGFTEKLPPFRRIIALENKQNRERTKREGAVSAGFLLGGFAGGVIARAAVAPSLEKPLPLRGPLTPEQKNLLKRWLPEYRILEKNTEKGETKNEQ